MSNRLLSSLASATSKYAASSLRNTNANATRHPVSRFIASPRFSSTEVDSTTTAPAASSSDNEIKLGVIKHFSSKEQYGFIIPDGAGENPSRDDLIFIHRNDIVRNENVGEKYYPSLTRGQRVQFKVAPPTNGGKKKKAVDLTFEGGEMVPPIKGVNFNRYESIQKAKFGDNVFDIMSTSVDQQEMEIKIVEAFERARENIERHKARMEKNTGASVGTKAGEE